MSFAAFVLKLEADSKGVGTGVNSAINHFKRLSKEIETQQKKAAEINKKFSDESFKRLKPEEQLNVLLHKRADIVNRISKTESETARRGYLLKQYELEKQILGIQKQRVNAAAELDARLRGQLGAQLRKNVVKGGGGISPDAISDLLHQIPGAASAARLAGILRPFGVAGGAAAVGLGAGGLALSAAGDANELKDLQLTSGLSLNALQKLKLGSTGTGTDFDGLVTGAKELRDSQSKAINGDAKALKHFQRLGISESDLSSLSTEELFFKIAGMGVTTQNFSSLQSVFGSGSDDVIKAFNNGLSGLTDKLEKFGAIIDDNTINELSSFKGSLQQINAAGAGVWSWFKSGLGKGFSRVNNNIASLMALATGNTDAVGILQSENELLGDEDYGASLAHTRRLEQKLEDRKSARSKEDAEAEEDFWAEWEYLRNGTIAKTDKKKMRRNAESFGGIDTDALARIGLFQGGTSETRKFQENILREVRSIQRDIEDIKRESE